MTREREEPARGVGSTNTAPVESDTLNGDGSQYAPLPLPTRRMTTWEVDAIVPLILAIVPGTRLEIDVTGMFARARSCCSTAYTTPAIGAKVIPMRRNRMMSIERLLRSEWVAPAAWSTGCRIRKGKRRTRDTSEFPDDGG